MNFFVLKFIWVVVFLLCLSVVYFVRSEIKLNIVIMFMDDVSFLSVVEIFCCFLEFIVLVYLVGYVLYFCIVKFCIFLMNLVE